MPTLVLRYPFFLIRMSLLRQTIVGVYAVISKHTLKITHQGPHVPALADTSCRHRVSSMVFPFHLWDWIQFSARETLPFGVWVRAWCGVGESWARRPSGEEIVGTLKSTPRRSWTGGASRAGGKTGKAGHEGNAKGVHEGRARRADERTGG